MFCKFFVRLCRSVLKEQRESTPELVERCIKLTIKIMSDSESTVEKTARCAIMARISFSHAIKLTAEKYSRADNPSVCLIQFDGLMFMYLQDSQCGMIGNRYYRY